LIYDAAATKLNKSTSTSILDDAGKNVFNVTQVNDRLFNIQSTIATSPLSLTYNGNVMPVFEVVQFKDALGAPATGTSFGNLRETQPLAPGMEGYLMPAQGGEGITLTDTTSSMLIVASDANGALSIKRLDDVFNLSYVKPAVFNDGPTQIIITGWTNYNRSGVPADLAAINAIIVPNGQVPLASGTISGKYNRRVAYLSTYYTTLGISDPKSVTEYTGTLTDPAAILADVTKWTNGKPLDFTTLGYTTAQINDGFGVSPLGVFVLVIQDMPTGATDPTIAANPVFTGFTYKGAWRPVYIRLTEQCNCPQQFIAPDWMAKNQLLNFPLKNQVWKLTDPNGMNLWFNKATGDQAIIKAAAVAADSTSVKFTYETKITGGSTTAAPGQTFQTGVDVPLYRISSTFAGVNYYLTVDATTNAFAAPGSTEKDVTGVNLKWVAEKYTTTAAAAKNIALQLFAISGTQTTPNLDGWYTGCQAFVYLPLASYIIDYDKGQVDTSLGLRYNTNLGMAGNNDSSCSAYAPLNDINSSFRVWYNVKMGDPTGQMNLIVTNATGGNDASTPNVASKWQKMPLKKLPACADGVYIQKVNSNGVYYINGTPNTMTPGKTAMSDIFLAHWNIVTGTNDTITINPELQTNIYGGNPCTLPSVLTGKYFIVDSLAPNTYVAFNQVGYGVNGNYTATFDTLYITCVDKHTSAFYDLEASGYNLNTDKLAIFETPFVDRNITYKIVSDPTTPTPVASQNGNVTKYMVYIKSTKQGDSDATPAFLNVYKENVRVLSGKHVIPYYSFSLEVNKTEYFLNVNQNNGLDSLYWTDVKTVAPNIYTELTATAVANKGDLGNLYKFCLPYVLKADSTRADSVLYGVKKFPPVYMQTMELAGAGATQFANNVPYILATGSQTKYVTVRKLTDALMPNKSPDWTTCGIYSMNYVDIDPVKAASWIFGNPITKGNIWVPINKKDPTTNIVLTDKVGNQRTGQFTLVNQSPGVPGDLFIGQSNQTPNYGILTGITNAPALTVTFAGDSTIGVTKLDSIWYYKISLGTSYLTDATGRKDATGNIPNDTYYNTFYNGTQSVSYPYAIFASVLPDYHNVAKGYSPTINADSAFVQTFGFHYLPDLYDQDPQQKFWIVSNADYTHPAANNYRYLAQVNTRLTFVGGTNATNNVLVFQWGKAAGGAYTNLEVVGQGNIFGVKDGVRFLSTTGAVQIYSIDGRLIKSAVLNGTDQVVSAPRGIAIVKAGSNVVKVVVQ